MVAADLDQHSAVHPVDPRVAEVGDQPRRFVAVDQDRGRDRRPRSGPADPSGGVLLDPPLARLQGADDRPGRRVRVVRRPGQPGELLDHDRARHVAARVAPHPVGDQEDRRLGEVRVLVDLAHQADVGGRGVPELDGHQSRTSSVGRMSTSGFRSLADQLRSWPDARLSRLLTERPDLATPAPHDSAQLASRAATRSSILRALDQLTRAELAVLDALVLTGRSSVARLQQLVNAEPAVVAAAVERLLELALAWESTGGLRALTGVADGLTGSAEQGVSGLRAFTDPPPPAAAVEESVAALSEPARAMLEHVVDAGGEATTGSARVTVLPEDAATPAEELLSRRLLVPRAGAPAVVPGEVGVALRSGRTTAEPVDAVPTLATSARERRPGRPGRGGRGLRVRTPPRAAPRPLGRSSAVGAAQRRPGRARPAGHRDRHAPGRADRGPARRDGRGGGPGHHGGRRCRQPGVAADRPVRRVGPAAHGRALDRAGPGLAGQPADAGPRGLARPGRQAVERAGTGARRGAHARVPADDAGRARRPPAG